MKHDFLLDKFEGFSKALAKTLFDVKEDVDPIQFDNLSNKDILYIVLKKLLKEGEFNKGEDLFYKELYKNKTQEFYELGQWFYNYLLNQDDKLLEERNFPRREIYQGLEDLQEFKYKYLIKEIGRAHV